MVRITKAKLAIKLPAKIYNSPIHNITLQKPRCALAGVKNNSNGKWRPDIRIYTLEINIDQRNKIYRVRKSFDTLMQNNNEGRELTIYRNIYRDALHDFPDIFSETSYKPIKRIINKITKVQLIKT